MNDYEIFIQLQDILDKGILSDDKHIEAMEKAIDIINSRMAHAEGFGFVRERGEKDRKEKTK